jgi:hypothetical protein
MIISVIGTDGWYIPSTTRVVLPSFDDNPDSSLIEYIESTAKQTSGNDPSISDIPL